MTILPIVERELRRSCRKATTYWLRTVAASLAMTALVFVLISAGSTRPAQLSMPMFVTLTVMAMAFCLLAGVFLTSDSLSAEKREGTAGLLFLTDLRGYDVVLGKLAGSSLHTCYGLISVLPVLAIPLLMGGVTAGEFWRVVLVLLATLFFSLAIGTAVSAFGRESRQTMLGTLFVILVFAAVMPVAATAILRMTRQWPLLWPSPGFTCYRAFDACYRFGRGATEYWGSLGTVVGLAVIFLAAASYRFPSAWQEQAQAGAADKQGLWRRLRFGSRSARAKARAPLLAHNPFLWLAMRDRFPTIVACAVSIVAFVTCAILVRQAYHSVFPAGVWQFQTAMILSLSGCLIFKCLVAVEATRRFNDDRQSGALELLLVTAIPVEQIIRGQRRALNLQFLFPMCITMSVFPLLKWFFYDSGWGTFSRDGLPAVIFVGNMLVLWTDYLALSWVGMRAGLNRRQHYRAVLGTLARVLFLPWIAFFVLLTPTFSRSVSQDEMTALFVIWFLVGIVNDLIWAGLAWASLLSSFRLRAAEDKVPILQITGSEPPRFVAADVRRLQSIRSD